MASESDPNNVTLGLVATPPTVFDAPSAEPGPGNRKYLPSLAEQVEQKIFEELSNYIQKESKESVFAVGGSIPITSLDDHLICESDDTASEGDDGIHEQHLSKEYTEFLVSRAGPGLDGPGHGFTSIAQPNVNALGTSSHRMRCEPITIRWDSNTHASASHKVSLPVKDEERPMFEQLLKDCSPASFGRGGKDVVDESYRKAGKLDVSAFCTSFNPHALGIVETAAQALVLSNKTQTNETHGIRAELYKSPSGMFKAHIDTPRSEHQIGSLFVCLSHVHEGGQLVLQHRGREIVFDWSGEKGRHAIQWAAFYSDCEHEVLEVTSGERITLTYNLYATCSADMALIDPEHVELYHTMKTLLEQPGFCKNGARLGYHCAHAYPHTSKDTIAAFPATLKGVDKVVYTCFAATNHSVRLRHLLEVYDQDPEYNDIYGGLLQTVTTRTLPRLEALKEHYRRIPDEQRNQYTNTKNHYLWQRTNDPDFEKRIDVAVLSDDLVPFHYTQTGLYVEGHDAIIRSWTRNFTVEKVKWLNQSGHSEPALVHGAYGNEASIQTTYARLVIILEVPPFPSR